MTSLQEQKKQARKSGSGALIDNTLKEYTFSGVGLDTLITTTHTTTLKEAIRRLEEKKKPMYHDECINGQTEICTKCMSGQVYNSAIDHAITVLQDMLNE